MVRTFLVLKDVKIASLHWFKINGSFAGPNKQGGLPRHKFLSWQTSLLCIVVKLAGGGSSINGLPLSSCPLHGHSFWECLPYYPAYCLQPYCLLRGNLVGGSLKPVHIRERASNECFLKNNLGIYFEGENAGQY